MKKDLQSFEKHTKDYEEIYTLDKVKEILKEYTRENLFQKLGFEKAINKTKNINTHIDIGCGSGWLLYETSLLFKKVIGIEPSKTILEKAKIITSNNNYSNIEFLNTDMIDGIDLLEIKEPVFITTSTVLSHIKDFYVKKFLKRLNSLPEGSYLFFDERYDKNIQQNMWHIRNKNWWAKNLNNWQLEFFELENSGYKSGIFGTKIKKGEKINYFDLTFFEKIKWQIEGILNKINRIVRFLKKKFSKKN